MGHGVKDFDPPPDHENESMKRAKELVEKENEILKRVQELADKENEFLKRAKELADKENELLKHAKQLADKERELVDRENEELKRARELMDKENEELKRACELADQENEKLKQELSDMENAIDMENRIERGSMPTAEEIEEAERLIDYQKDKLHLAIAGFAGTGKSSLINALRCLRDTNKHAAKTGTSETTLDIGRYPDPATEPPFNRFVWYDIPGAGTQTVSLRTYVKNQALYIFDVVVLVIGSRFLDSDAEVLKHCHNLKVPTVIVRSRADEQVRNIEQMRELAGYDDEEGAINQISWPKTPRKEFIDNTKDNIAKELRKKGLPDQRVHIVSSAGVYRIAAYLRGKNVRPWPAQSQSFDEEDFVEEVMVETYKRRYRTQNVDRDEAGDC